MHYPKFIVSNQKEESISIQIVVGVQLLERKTCSVMVTTKKKTIKIHFIPLYTGYPLTGTLTNSEYPDGMPHDAAFHQGLHCSLW